MFLDYCFSSEYCCITTLRINWCKTQPVIKQIIMIIINNNWMRFCDIRNNQGRGKCNQPRPEAGTDYICLDLDYRISQKPNSIIVLLYIVLWKIYKNYCVKCKYKGKRTKRPHRSKPFKCSNIYQKLKFKCQMFKCFS